MARVCWFAGSLCFLFDNDRNSILSFWHSLSNQPALAIFFFTSVMFSFLRAFLTTVETIVINCSVAKLIVFFSSPNEVSRNESIMFST